MPNMSNKSPFAALGVVLALATFSLFACVTSKKLHQVSLWMTQSEVIRIWGKSDGFRNANGYE
jgi:hypothetical protein